MRELLAVHGGLELLEGRLELPEELGHLVEGRSGVVQQGGRMSTRNKVVRLLLGAPSASGPVSQGGSVVETVRHTYTLMLQFCRPVDREVSEHSMHGELVIKFEDEVDFVSPAFVFADRNRRAVIRGKHDVSHLVGGQRLVQPTQNQFMLLGRILLGLFTN